MNNKTFAEELNMARRKFKGEFSDSETCRVHKEAVHDPKHAFRSIEIRKPDPWGGRTSPTLWH